MHRFFLFDCGVKGGWPSPCWLLEKEFPKRHELHEIVEADSPDNAFVLIQDWIDMNAHDEMANERRSLFPIMLRAILIKPNATRITLPLPFGNVFFWVDGRFFSPASVRVKEIA